MLSRSFIQSAVKFLALQKFRFDLGGSFLSLINFGLLVFSNKAAISSAIGLPPKALLPLAVVAVIIAVWLGGYILDRMKYWNEYQQVHNERSEMLKKALEK